MNRAPFTAVALLAFACLTMAFADDKHDGTAAPAGARAAAHGDDIGLKLPADLQWKDTPALPPGAKVALLEGDPTKEGFFAMRVKMPDGYRIPPHFHPTHERLTIISGTFHLGHGEKFDKSAAKALPTGAYSTMPPNMRHFAWAEGETIVQVTTTGPWGITYVNPADDPRKKQ